MLLHKRVSLGLHRCFVCSRKVKMSKLIYLGEHDFCESCFKRQYALRSAIDHFLVRSYLL